MFSTYFAEAEKKLIKTYAPQKEKPASKASKTKPAAAKKAPAKKAAVKKADYSTFADFFQGVLPVGYQIGQFAVEDTSGFSPKGVDLTICKPHCRDFAAMLGNVIPPETAYAFLCMAPQLNKLSLEDALARAADANKLEHYLLPDDESETGVLAHIPSFVVSFDTTYSFPDLKNDVVEYYNSQSIDHFFEFDIMAIMGKGMLIKDWREKRSWIAIETGVDTLQWFYILLNEYVEGRNPRPFDLRSLVKSPREYKE